MAVAERYENSVKVRCCDCGERIVISGRSNRDHGQAHRCSICRALQRHAAEPVTDRHRRYWLNHFSDAEIALLASDLLNEDVSVSRVRERWPRAQLGV